MVLRMNGLQPSQVTAPEKIAATELSTRSFSPVDVSDMSSTGSAGSGVRVLHIDAVRQTTTAVGASVDFQTFTLPGGTLSVDGDSVDIEISGQLVTSATSASVHVRTWFGATPIGGALAVGNIGSHFFIVRATVTRVNANLQYSGGIEGLGGSASAISQPIVFGITPHQSDPVENLANPVIIKARGDVNSGTGGAVHVDRLIVKKVSV